MNFGRHCEVIQRHQKGFIIAVGLKHCTGYLGSPSCLRGSLQYCLFQNQQKWLEPFLPLCKQEDRVSVKFGFSMLWIQMSTASRGSGWCHVWHHRSEQGLGWLTKSGVVELFTFHISSVSKTLSWVCLTYSAVLFLWQTCPLSYFLSVMVCVSLKIFLFFFFRRITENLEQVGCVWRICLFWLSVCCGIWLCGYSAKPSQPALPSAWLLFVTC